MRRIDTVTISAPLAAMRVEHHLPVRIAGGAEEQPRVKLAAGDDQRIGMIGCCCVRASSALQRAHDLDRVARSQRVRPSGAPEPPSR